MTHPSFFGLFLSQESFEIKAKSCGKADLPGDCHFESVAARARAAHRLPEERIVVIYPSTLDGKTPSVQWSRQDPQYKVSVDPKRVQNKMFCSFAHVAQIALWPYVG